MSLPSLSPAPSPSPQLPQLPYSHCHGPGGRRGSAMYAPRGARPAVGVMNAESLFIAHNRANRWCCRCRCAAAPPVGPGGAAPPWRAGGAPQPTYLSAIMPSTCRYTLRQMTLLQMSSSCLGGLCGPKDPVRKWRAAAAAPAAPPGRWRELVPCSTGEPNLSANIDFASGTEVLRYGTVDEQQHGNGVGPPHAVLADDVLSAARHP